MMKRFTTMMAMAVIAMVLFVGCGKPATLEEAVQNSESAQEKINEMASSSGVSIAVEENTVTYTYSIGRDLDEDTKALVVEQLEEQMSGYDSTFIDIAKGLEDNMKISGVTVVVNYVDNSGNIVYSATYNATERVTE